MENISNNNRLKKELQAEQNILKADYEYLLNREKKLVSEKQLLLDKLLKLKAVLSEAK
jgi:hypothetical protein